METLVTLVSDAEKKQGDVQKVVIQAGTAQEVQEGSPNGFQLADTSWKELLRANEPKLDQRDQNPSSKIDQNFIINRDAPEKFSSTDYFRKSDEVSRERTARYVVSYYHTLVGALNTPIVKGNDQILRVTVRNLGNNYCMIGNNQNVTLQNMMDIVFGAAGTVPVPGESVQMEGSTDIWLNSPSGTTVLVKIEYSRI